MDIYKYAKENPYADYMDMTNFRIYHIQEWTEEIKTNPDARIRVTDGITGEFLGYASPAVKK